MLTRILASLLAATTVALLTLFAPLVSIQQSFKAEGATYSVKAVDQLMVCPGAVLKTGGGGGTEVGRFDRTGLAELAITGSGEGDISIATLDGKSSSTKTSSSQRIDFAESSTKAISISATNRLPTDPQGSEVLMASQFQTLSLDSLKGFAASSCQQPSSNFFLVGGSTAAGREALLILANPSPIDATANLRIFSDLGEISVSGLSGISVLAESTTVISLASFAPTVSELSVQVESEGAKLAGWLQQRAARGTSAEGVDFVPYQLEPQLELVIPGLVIRGAKELVKLQERGDEYSDVSHALRIFAPEGATITAQVVSSDEQVFGAALTGEVSAGSVLDIPINELEDGDYTIYVSADKPVFASARLATANKDSSPRAEFSWLTPAENITSSRYLALGDREGILVLANNLPELVTATVNGESFEVPSFSAVSQKVTGTISISSNQGVFAQVTLFESGGVASLQVLDPKNLGSEVSVQFR